MEITELFDTEEYERWLGQAENTLRSAEHDSKAGDYNWACFKCQQAAEYAIKGMLWGLGKPAAGHSLLKLLEELKKAGINASRGLSREARTLDKHYIPPRYPNTYATGSPFEFYDVKDAEEAIAAATKVIAFVREQKEKL